MNSANLMVRVLQVIRSCKTYEQTKAAANYAMLAIPIIAENSANGFDNLERAFIRIDLKKEFQDELNNHRRNLGIVKQ